MAYSIQRAVSDGTLNLLDLSINYRERAEISVYFDTIIQAPGTTWAWVGSVDKKISFTPNVPNGVEVVVKRTTDLSDLRHRYSAGAAFTAGSVDESLEQVLHIAQEATEGQLGQSFYNDINMHAYKIKNLGDAVDAKDAVPFAQYKADALGAYNSRIGAEAARDTTLAAKDVAVAAKDTAAAYASTATTQANTATTKAAEAAGSAAASAASANAAAASYDSFDDRYLGAKLVAPTVDNDGNAILTGALYWDSVAGKMYAWNGSTWITSDILSAVLAGNLTFNRAGARIRGDFSNATVANRVMLQTSTLNGATQIYVIPNGTSTNSGVGLSNAADPANASIASLGVTSSAVVLDSWKTGTGTYLPMTFHTGDTERMRISTDGNVTVGAQTGLGAKFEIHSAQSNGLRVVANSGLSAYDGPVALFANINNNYAPVDLAMVRAGLVSGAVGGESGNLQLFTKNLGTLMESLRIEATGDVLAMRGVLGYGTGGTVGQATSKSTAVTINRPSGIITTHNAALASGGKVTFAVINAFVVSGLTLPVVAVVKNTIGDSARYRADVSYADNGVFYITLENIGYATHSDNVEIAFAINRVSLT